MSSYFFITKTFFLYCFIKDASSWILRFKKIWRPKKPGENLENLCVFVQGYTWAIGAVGQFGAGSLKNLITSSQPWQGCRWGLLRVPPQKKAAELFWCVFFFSFVFFWSLWILFWIKMYHHLSSCIIYHHYLSSLWDLWDQLSKTCEKTVNTENDGTWGKKRSPSIDRSTRFEFDSVGASWVTRVRCSDACSMSVASGYECKVKVSTCGGDQAREFWIGIQKIGCSSRIRSNSQ